MGGSKHTLGGSMKYWTLNSFSKTAEIKNTLMHKCTIYSTSGLFRHFLIPPRSGSTRYHNALSNEISSDRTSLYVDGPMHSVFAKNLNLSQFKGSRTQIQIIRYYIEEIYSILIHWWGVYAILLLCWGKRCFLTLLSYTQHQYVAEVYSTSIHCWAVPNLNTLLM